jgi:hypothetical protein
VYNGDLDGLVPRVPEVCQFSLIELYGDPTPVARGTRHDRPGYVVLPDALGALTNPGTKGTTCMNTRPNIIAHELSAIPAVGGNKR